MSTRLYRVYAWARGGRLTADSKHYRTGMWIYDVRAQNMRQAYALAGQEVVALDSHSDVGITRLGRSDLTPEENLAAFMEAKARTLAQREAEERSAPYISGAVPYVPDDGFEAKP